MWKCDKCGIVDCVLFDGYTVDDRLLEGVMFECRHDEKRHINVNGVQKCFAKYFSDLNEKKWLKEVEEVVQDYDILSCSKCGQDVDNIFVE